LPFSIAQTDGPITLARRSTGAQVRDRRAHDVISGGGYRVKPFVINGPAGATERYYHRKMPSGVVDKLLNW
jgi:hypothetical protein